MKLRRTRMAAALPIPPARLAPPARLPSRLPDPADPAEAALLGRLLYDSYHGTIDDEGESPEASVELAARLFDGAFGPFYRTASVVYLAGPGAPDPDRPVAATLITRFELIPLLAFSVTDPAYRRQGLARAGLSEAMRRLSGGDHDMIRLVVTQGNPAEHLYASMGFREIAG